jgi:hypothetical protein
MTMAENKSKCGCGCLEEKPAGEKPARDRKNGKPSK